MCPNWRGSLALMPFLRQSVPVLISLETSENEAIAEKAFGLHSILQNKHASIINTRYLESVKMAFQYRQKLHLQVSGKLTPIPSIIARKLISVCNIIS
jgi:hypothetical protein